MDLRIESLEKRFGDKLAVQIPSLEIAGGEFFAFVGPSGCGKTTTLNLIAGLEEPTNGSISLGERLLNDLPPHKRDVAFVFQSYALYPHRTVSQNLAFPLEMARVNRAQIDHRVREVAASLDITALLGHRPAQLSGGERQRVALGRAMVRQPQLFLFDEPLSNLDAPLRAQMRREIKRLHQQLGTTFIYVTHDQEEALSLSDRIAVMHSGRIQQCGSPREIYERPTNRFVAGFFGNPPMNFLNAAMTGQEGEICAQVGEHRLALPENQGWSRTGSVVLGIRPEHVGLSRESGEAAWPARISLVELRGSQTYLEIDLDGAKLSAIGGAEQNDRVGQPVWVHLPPSRILLFDPETGASLRQTDGDIP
jgi:multiple sugar transport system ATP-binding protein